MLDTLKPLRFRFARIAMDLPILNKLVSFKPNVTNDVVPPHVPRELVRQLDIYNLPGGADSVHLAWKRIQDESPDIYFTPYYGGYWVLNRADLIAEVFPDYERFSSVNSIGIPPMPEKAPPMLPIASDPPEHKSFRQPINLAVAPKQLQLLSEDARQLAIELIENLKPKGECEFMRDFSGHLPMTIFLRLVDLPMNDREYLIGLTEVQLRGTEEERARGAMEVFEYLDRYVVARRKSPGNDLLSQIVNLKIGDRPITHDEALGEAAQVLFGGLDTVAGTMGFIAAFLAQNPDHQRQLVEDPSLIPNAVDELVRRHSIPNIARRVTHDMEFHGVQLKKDDQVMIPICLHGLDERAWPDSLKVDFTRRVGDHHGFGKGQHRCPGANLARLEMRIFLEEWLKRIPKFSLKPGTKPVNLPGQVMGISEVHLTWPTQ